MGKESKHKSSKDHHSKHKKHKKKYKKDHKREKEHKRRRDYSSSSDSETSSGCDAPRPLDVNTQLAMGRAAARAVREILAYKYELRSEIRQLARHLDAGNALDISGLDDDFLRGRLCTLFDNLTQLKKTSSGHYMKIPKSATVLAFVAPILEESPASLASYKVVVETVAQPQKADENKEEAEVNDDDNDITQPIGPDTGPLAVSLEAGGGGAGDGGDAEEQGQEEAQKMPAETTNRRVLGPSMPPPEVLAAAAELPVDADDVAAPGPSLAAMMDDEFTIGPPPPEVMIEYDAASMDDRSAEVVRVLEVLRQHEAESGGTLQAATTAGAAPEPHPPDAYLVLGVDADAPVEEIKKRYWKLSLLIHPDKCDHPEASVAFQAVATAAQALQDASGRAAVDKRREEAELQRFTLEYAAQQERERQWRIARGQATKEDLNPTSAAAAVGKPASRETWMTELPPERGPAAPAVPRGNQTAFSSRAPQARGDTSGWTMTPEERAAGVVVGPAAGPGLLMDSGADAGRAEKAAAAVDAYNSSARGKSLLEQHLEKQGKQSKKSKKRKKGDAAEEEADEGWDKSAHPWRPFDREKDLEIKPSGASNPQEMLKNMKGLSSRFAGSSSGGGKRSFL